MSLLTEIQERSGIWCAPAGPAAVDLDSLTPGSVTGWAAYPAGIAWALREAGYEVPGATIDLNSDLPVGAGLSSSAGLECTTALALTGLADVRVLRRELAGITRRAENEFVGVPPGIMDQSASLLCQAGAPCSWTVERWRPPRYRLTRPRPGPGCSSSTRGPSMRTPAGTTPGGERNARRRRASSGCRSSGP